MEETRLDGGGQIDASTDHEKPRLEPTVRSYGWVVSYERGTPVGVRVSWFKQACGATRSPGKSLFRVLGVGLMV